MPNNMPMPDNKLKFNLKTAFIPIAAHLNKTTVGSKNADVIQVIKISSLDQSTSNIKNAIKNLIGNNKNISIWLNTVRHKKNIDIKAPENILAFNIHNSWQKVNNISDVYFNDLYISVVMSSSIKYNLQKPFFSKEVLFSNKISKKLQGSIEEAIERITTITNSLMEELREFSPELLSVYEKDGKMYSPICSLYYFLINYKWKEIEISDSNIDASVMMDSYYISNTEMQIVSSDMDKDKYISVIAIKDRNHNANITNAINIVNGIVSTEIICSDGYMAKLASNKGQKDVLNISSDEILIDLLKTEGDDSSLSTQAIVTIYSDSIDGLYSATNLISSNLAKQGIVHILVDLELEALFWSCLPSNFAYIKYAEYTPKDHIALFVDLVPYNAGKARTKLGDALMLSISNRDLPYFISANNGDRVLFVSDNKHDSISLCNFYLMMLSKYNPSVLHLHKDEESKLAIRALNGSWNKSYGTNLFHEKDISKENIYTALSIIAGRNALLDGLSEKLVKAFNNDIFIESIFKGNSDIDVVQKLIDFFNSDLYKNNKSEIIEMSNISSYPLPSNAASAVFIYKLLEDFRKRDNSLKLLYIEDISLLHISDEFRKYFLSAIEDIDMILMPINYADLAINGSMLRKIFNKCFFFPNTRVNINPFLKQYEIKKLAAYVGTGFVLHSPDNILLDLDINKMSNIGNFLYANSDIIKYYKEVKNKKDWIKMIWQR